ncbi:DUF221-domain-containing protein [Infundibulicybe gibba]|nr:DUF221-domain-containing protein [Infundibulicybe gibba]
MSPGFERMGYLLPRLDITPLQDALKSGRNLAPAAVGSNILFTSAISIVTIVAFNLLRPKNKIIYEPKVKYHADDKPPPPISDSLFGWLPPLIHTKEPELMDKVGLDAVTFLRFLRLMRWLFTGITLLACGLLIPINYIFNIKHIEPQKRDVLSAMTIRDVKGNRLYAHVAVTYLITFLVMGLVYVFWRDMVKLRKQFFRSPEYIQSFYARTLSITHVPKKFQSDAGLKSILESMKMPYPATSVHIGRRVGRFPELIEYHNQTVRELEAVLVRYLKGGRIGRKRPTIRVGGFCGLGGTRKDAIDFYTTKLKRTESAVQEYRSQIDTRKAENYGFASLAAVPYAHIVARKLAGKHFKGTDITLAPNPKDIIWSNMDKSDAAIARKQMLGFIWLGIICFLSLIPLLPVATLANLDAITTTGYVPFLKDWSINSPILYSIVSGVLPPVVSGLFTFFLPRIMRWLSEYMGALTHARLDRAVIARYFAFLVISQLIVFTLIGVVFNSVIEIITLLQKHSNAKEILANLNKLPDVVTKTYINQASYWLKWFPLRGFLVIFDLAQIVNLVWISFKTRIFGRTPRDIRDWTKPPEFEYAIYYSNLLFMCAVAMLFAPLAPLVALAAAIVFWLSSWVHKYQLMFVFVTKVETGGRLWNVVINRVLASVVMMQLLMVLTIGLQYKFKSLQWISTVPPIIILLAFKIYISRKFDDDFRYYIPSETEIKSAIVYSERADARSHKLENRFGHPALHSDLFTPMLHAKMMPLLKEIYKGKITEHVKTRPGKVEYNGTNKEMDSSIIEGIKITAVDQMDLEYDPILYQRDRGELDWDTQSIASTNALSVDYSKSQLIGTPNSNMDLNRYYASGPSSPMPTSTPLELLTDQRQLLATGQQPGYFVPHARVSTAYSTSPSELAPLHGGYNPSDTSLGRNQVQSWYSAHSIPASPGEPYQQYPQAHPQQYPAQHPAPSQVYNQQVQQPPQQYPYGQSPYSTQHPQYPQ